MEKMKIAVLAGGKSTERNVSLSSGSKITNALRSKGYDATMIDLFLGYELEKGQNVEDIFKTSNTSTDYEINDDVLTDADIEKLRTDGTVGLFGKNVLRILQAADFVFLALHGGDGENGKVQAVLDLNNIKYTGSGSLASGIAMDKAISKEIMLYNDIKTAKFSVLHEEDGIHPQLDFGYPMVVKPNNGGSSIGTRIVHDDKELAESLSDAYRFDDEIIVEEFITGREFSLGVVNGEAMPAIEIVVNDGWYDYEHKFQTGSTTQFITPPNIDEDVHSEMKRVAVQTMAVLGMTNYGRVDFLTNETGVYVIEANNLPGMTPLSLLPQEAEAAGISYEDLCESIVLGKQKLYKQLEK
ncbi:D-alanine--D-alanine ligase [Pediococcus stilesii]|uniref:D-alanine--D-alanine ligase n=2 Tax=Pediococcus stilesii TaxID=331679 RepID=A0A0R2KY17_9LACO|nr:D-alanine--D-alanine ligase [Pediococcus stilesii]